MQGIGIHLHLLLLEGQLLSVTLWLPFCSFFFTA